MPKAPLLQTNVSQGEVSDFVEARPDLAKRFNGARTVENCWLLPEGGATRRPGLMLGSEVQDSSEFTRLIPFEYSVDEVYVLMFGAHKIRFVKNRSLILSGLTPYELAEPYHEGDLRDIHYQQSNDFMFMTSLNPALDVQKLARIADDNWTIGDFGATPAPSSEADEDLGAVGAINLNTGSALFYLESDQFLAGDVGRQILAGTGRGIISVVDAPRQVQITILDAFSETITPSGNTLTSVGTAVASTAHGRSAGEFVILSAGAQSGQIHQITAIIDANNFTIDAAFSPDQGAAVSYNWTAGFPAGAWLLHLSPQAALTVSAKEPVGASVTIVAAVPTFRSSYVGKFIDIWGGVIQISSVTDTLNARGQIMTLLQNATTPPAVAQPGSWRLQEASWSSTGGRPRTLCIHQGRLVLAGAPPTTINGSDIDNIYNFATGSLAENAWEYNLQGGQQNPIQWLVSLISLYVGDATKEHAARGQGIDKPISGEEIPFIVPIDGVGSMHVQPVVVDNAILLHQRFGQDIVQMSYSLNDSPDASAFVSSDVTLFARHLGEMGFSLHRAAYAKKPNSIVFFPMDNGQLCGLTFKPRQEVSAWSRTKTGQTDAIESVAVVPHEDGTRLTIHVVTKRFINGEFKRFWEYFEDDHPALQSRITDGVKWAGLQTDCAEVGTILAGATTITGITHLPNMMVDVIIGDKYIGQKLVALDGVITLDEAAGEVPRADTVFEVGLHYDSTLTTLRPSVPNEVTEGLKRSWPIVHVRVKDTIGGTINGKPLKRQENSQRMYTGLLKMENLETEDPYDGALTITQEQAYPLTIINISGQVSFGDGFV